MGSQLREAASIKKNFANLLLSHPAAPSSTASFFAQATLKGSVFSWRCRASCLIVPSVARKKKKNKNTAKVIRVGFLLLRGDGFALRHGVKPPTFET